MIHLDTSFLIRALVRGTPEDAALRQWLREGEVIGISTIGWAEFLCGPVASEHVSLAARVVPERIPFAVDHAVAAARLFNASGRRRGSLADCMIAAVAVEHGATLATADPSDFERLAQAGLVVTSA